MGEQSRKNLNDGPTGRWGYDSRLGRNHLDGSSVPSHRMERNSTFDFNGSSRHSGGSAIAIGPGSDAKWFPYRIAIIVSSGSVAITGFTLFLIACIKGGVT